LVRRVSPPRAERGSGTGPYRLVTLRHLVVVAVVAAALVVTGRGFASALSAFHTPGWAVQCYVIGQEQAPVLRCSTPRDGRFLEMGATGRPSTGVNPRDRHIHDPFAARRTLRFGRYWAFGSMYGCVSKTGGVMCWNSNGHGWWIGRGEGYRGF
jgi:hypothetical protein